MNFDKDLDARGYVDLTVAAMSAFGARVSQVDHTTWRVEPTKYTATDFVIEPDASAATYLWAAEALNTAIELLGDEITLEKRPRIGQAKDVAAFAVLVTAVIAVVLAALVFWPRVL